MTQKQQKKNPYKLTWYDSNKNERQIRKNNTNYFDWEIKYNEFVPENVNLKEFEEYKKTITL